MVHQKLVHDFRGGAISRNFNKLKIIGPNPINNNIFDISSKSRDTPIPLLDSMYLDEVTMEISFDISLSFLIEKKLILLSHICSIKYIRPY